MAPQTRQYKTKIYCSNSCRLKKYDRVCASWIKENSLTDGTVGAISELYASIDLFRQGFHVFRALSPASPCDLIVLKENKCFPFEVRTKQYGWHGALPTPDKNIRVPNLAVVTLSDFKVHYFPELNDWKTF